MYCDNPSIEQSQSYVLLQLPGRCEVGVWEVNRQHCRGMSVVWVPIQQRLPNIFLVKELSLVWLIFNPQRTRAARVIQYLLCHSVRPYVCLLPRFLPLRTTRQQNSDTNRFISTLARFKKIAIFVYRSAVNKPIC